MKIVSFNINSIRARPHQVEAIVKKHNPDAIGFQETKVHDDDFPYDIPESLGYKAHIHGQKGHYGVAIFTKDDPYSVNKGFETDTEESQKIYISYLKKKENSYFECHFQGEERSSSNFLTRQFDDDSLKHIKKNFDPKDYLVVMYLKISHKI